MSIIPWDDWFYPGIERYKAELNGLRSRYQAQRQAADKRHEMFQAELATYKSMLAYNSTLAITATVAKMNDDQFAQYVKEVQGGVDGPPKTYLPAEVARGISEATGGAFVTRAIYNLYKLVKTPAFSDAAGETILQDADGVASDAAALGMSQTGGEAAGETIGETIGETVGELAAEGAADGVLASTGVGIIAAFGLDAIIAAFEGAKEERDLDQACHKAEGALDKVDRYLAKVNNAINRLTEGIVVQERRFVRLMKELADIEPASFRWNVSADYDHAATTLGAMAAAVAQYGYLNVIRADWFNASHNVPAVTWKDFESYAISMRPANLSRAQAQGFLEILHQQSATAQDSSGRGAPPAAPPGPAAQSVLKPGEILHQGHSLFAGPFELKMQYDGKLILYKTGGVPLEGYYGGQAHEAVMQFDGNFVVYRATDHTLTPGDAIFASNTYGNPGAFLQLRDDGKVVIMKGHEALAEVQFPNT